ncbi:MAG: TIM44-related membrane protein TimA, partial [Caulobacteraceae bacterium]
MQILELIILAALAAVVLFQLYAVLGRRVGRGPQDLPQVQQGPKNGDTARLSQPAEDTGALSGLAAIKARDPAFDIGQFLQVARQAYQ